MFILIGLGNPGKEYEKTRHNAGFMVLDAVAERLGAAFTRRGFRCVYAEARLGSEKLVLAKPDTFMNASGYAAVELMNWFKPEHDRLIVVYDDIDLPCGAMRIRKNGSAGTHNGMRSLDEQLGFEDFPRIRVGIGRPAHSLIDHVLGTPSEEEAKDLAAAVSNAADAALLIVSGRLEEAQTKFNYKPPKKQPSPSGREKRDPLCYRPGFLAAQAGDPAEAASALRGASELFFENPCYSANARLEALPFTLADVEDAEARLMRLRPLIARLFPETERSGGLIESPLVPAEKLKKALLSRAGAADGPACGKLFLKLDSELPVSGSVKARGGIYEVLKHAEALAEKHGLLDGGDLASLADRRDFFSKYTVQVGSTGNLGLSIGVSASALGFRTIVHMSADAKQWKKSLLRESGVTVFEYDGDYSEAVRRGRESSENDETSYFIDDESSSELFLGYATAALRLKAQLAEGGVTVDAAHPLFVYLPCGVGGAPGGISFALRLVFGSSVLPVFVEPVNAPCMLSAFITGKCADVRSLGLSGKTEADGLAVSRASELVFSSVRQLVYALCTVSDRRLVPFVRLVRSTEGRFIEPSAAISLAGYIALASRLIAANEAGAKLAVSAEGFAAASHIIWATGGGLVPENERRLILG